jgi:hypothetical protein
MTRALFDPTAVFHVSEDADIRVFHPRPPPSPDAGVVENVVWAIDHPHLPNYLTPRDCPRVTYGRGPSTTNADAERFLSGVTGRVVAIEYAWLKRVMQTPIHVYVLRPGPTWRPLAIGAGYLVSAESVTPVDCIRIDSPAAAIADHGAELRVRANLWDLIDLVAESSLEFSIIRKRNAQPRP